MPICQIMRKPALVLTIGILTLFSLFSQSKNNKNEKTAAKGENNPQEVQIVYNETFEQAKELFGLNKPEEAIPLFEQLAEEKNIDPAYWIYLGVSYYQVGDFPKSYSTCTKGMALPGTDKKVLAFNAGNSAYALGNYARANACYVIAIKEDPEFGSAYLNRANAQLKQDYLQDSKENYEKFLQLQPEDEQAEKIRNLIQLLEEEIQRRANQKPEIIDPDDFIENRKMEIPVVPEKIVDNGPEPVEEEIVIADELIGDEAVAPDLNPEELTFKGDKNVEAGPEEVVNREVLPPEHDVKTAETIPQEAVGREILPPEHDEKTVETVPEEAVVHSEVPDFEEPEVVEQLEDVDPEDKWVR